MKEDKIKELRRRGGKKNKELIYYLIMDQDEDVIIEVSKIWSKITQLKALINYARRTIGSEKELYISRASSIIYQVEFDIEQYLARLKKQLKESKPKRLKIKARKAKSLKRNIFAENPFDDSSGVSSEDFEENDSSEMFKIKNSSEKDFEGINDKNTTKEEFIDDEAQRSLRALLLNQAIKVESVLNTIKTEEVEKELEIDKEQHNCLIHRGPITGVAYICPKCMAMYCLKCANTLHDQNERCWACDEEFHL